MNIHIPNSAFLGNIDAFIARMNFSDPSSLHITTNESWISVHPVVLTMIAALGMTVDPGKISVDDITASSGHYLARMGLFEMLGYPPPMHIKEHEPAGRFIQLTEIKDSNQLTEFLSNLQPLLHLEPQQANSIRYIVSELVRNVLEHSQSKFGAIVAAQYFAKTNTVRIGISDTGLGIWSTIHESHTARTDMDALKLALTPGITGTTSRPGGTDFNAGAGLFFIKSIAKINRDFFMLYSGNAMFKLLKASNDQKNTLNANPDRDKHSERSDLPSWQGTVVGIDLSLSNTAELDELLENIRLTYDDAVKTRKYQRIRRPRFV